jgi:CDP-glucose 4,6-dehydratase
MNADFWRNRPVFITGHTGFKGGWLALWLHAWGAKVHGYALPPDTTPNLFTVANVAASLTSHTLADVQDAQALQAAMEKAQPEILFHLAAQPLVRRSYVEPVATYATNVMGTVHVLEAVRRVESVRVVINVTTDKCYENREWLWPYREQEALGGYDPYSSSKACSEIITAAYRRSFLAEAKVAVASARAGNVIGGGDWSDDRLLPDFLRAIDAGQTLKIRSPQAVRPWQHVLEPLSGYIMLAESLYSEPSAFAEAWNFGPAEDDAKTVQWILEQLALAMPDARWSLDDKPQPHEAAHLKLDSSKARARLGWKPRWHLSQALKKTTDWHQAWKTGADMVDFSLRQVREYATTEGEA